MQKINSLFYLGQKLLWKWLVFLWILIFIPSCTSSSNQPESQPLEVDVSSSSTSMQAYIEDIPTNTPTQIALELTATPSLQLTLPPSLGFTTTPSLPKLSSTKVAIIATPTSVPEPTILQLPFSVDTTVNYMLWGRKLWDLENNQILENLDGMSFSLYPWSPDGKRLATFLQIGEPSPVQYLALVNLETTEVTFPPNTEYTSSRFLSPDGASSWSPLWSPNGQYLLYGISVEENQYVYRLVIYDLIAQEEIFLSNPIRLIDLSGWSFDSTQIAYVRWENLETEAGNTTVLEIMDIPSFEVHRPNQPDHLSFEVAHWSPTNKQLILYTGYVDYYSQLATYGYDELYIVDIPTGRFEQLKGMSARESNYYGDLYNPGYLVHGTPWSPDGESIIYSDRGLICYQVISSGQKSCFTGVEEEIFSLGGVGAVYPSWSPNGQWVGFVMKLDSMFCSPMAAVRFDGSDLRITDVEEGHCSLFGPTWSPAKR